MLCMFKQGKAQNSVYEVMITDTTAGNLTYDFRIPSSNLANVNKISFYKKMSGEDTLYLIKDIYNTRAGEYNLIADEGVINGIQQFFRTEFIIPRTEFDLIDVFYYRVNYTSSEPVTYSFNKN